MVIRATKIHSSFLQLCPRLVQLSSINRRSASETLEGNIKAAVETKSYQKILDLLSSEESSQNPNPFSFLSNFPQNLRTKVVKEMLQSFIPLRPRSRPQVTYSSLLSYTLQSPSPLPLSLAILQQILRSGGAPVPQTHLLLSSAWLKKRHESYSVANILLEMHSIGCNPDNGICNYLISSLCGVDQTKEAIKVLKGMGGAGCVPDLESYGPVISQLCTLRKTNEAVDMLKQMVEKVRLTPRQGMIIKLMAALRANREIRRAVALVELLEREGCFVGFESYEIVVEGCLEGREYIFAAKVVMGMTDRGFIPYIRVRQKVVEGLAGIGEEKLASATRQRLEKLKS